MTHPRHIALVGCGFTGTSAFFQLVDRYPVEKITVFEASGHFTSPRQPRLVQDLVANGLVGPYQRDGHLMAGADVDMSTFRARSARNVYVANMLLWGPGFFTSSAFTMATIVQRLLDSVFATSRP